MDMRAIHPSIRSLSNGCLILLLGVFLSCGSADEPNPADDAAVTEITELIERTKSGRQFVMGRVEPEDTAAVPAVVAVAKMRSPYRGIDGEYRIVAKNKVSPGERFEIEVPEIEYNAVYTVFRFHDSDDDGEIDAGSAPDFARAIVGKDELRGIFILTAGGTFVDDRLCDLTEAEFTW